MCTLHVISAEASDLHEIVVTSKKAFDIFHRRVWAGFEPTYLRLIRPVLYSTVRILMLDSVANAVADQNLFVRVTSHRKVELEIP